MANAKNESLKRRRAARRDAISAGVIKPEDMNTRERHKLKRAHLQRPEILDTLYHPIRIKINGETQCAAQ